MTRICLVGADSELQNQCRAVLEDVASGDWELIPLAYEAELAQAHLYIWDFQEGSVCQGLRPEMTARSLFLVDLKALERFRELLGATRASIVLKPVLPAALRPFLENAFRPQRPFSPAPRQSEAEDLLDGLLHANLKLQEYDRYRENFLARELHDFRAPLTALNGYCGLLTEQRFGPLSPSQMDLICRMQHSVKRLSRLTEAMFELSVGRNSKRELEIRQAEVEATINQAVHEVTPLAIEKQIGINVAVERPEQPLLFDPGRIEQVLINLLENACKFTPKQGMIEVSGYPVLWNNPSRKMPGGAAGNGIRTERTKLSNAYRIDVRDSGCGIPSHLMESVFEEFTSYTGGKDRSGGGLGLAICRMVVDLHQGSIWAESSASGTQFSFVLPYRGSASGAMRPRGKPASQPVGHPKSLSA